MTVEELGQAIRETAHILWPEEAFIVLRLNLAGAPVSPVGRLHPPPQSHRRSQ
jgi:hypothetical protein